MPIYQSLDVLNPRPAVSGDSVGEVLAVRGVVVVTAAILLADLFEAVRLPADHVPVDCIVDVDDLDTNGTPLLTLDCGIMSGTPGDPSTSRTVGNEFFAASTIAQAAVGFARAALRNSFRILPAPYDRSVGLKAAAAAATGVASLTNMNVDRGAWAAGTAYALNDFIRLPDGRRVKCTTAGTSGVLFPQALGTTTYNTTLADGTVTWTMGDPSIGLTLLYRAARYGV